MELDLGSVGVAALALIVVAALLGGVAQGSVGFGAAFATVPALALTRPELLPGAMLVAALPLSLTMAVLEREHLDRAGALRLIVGRLPGLAAGTVIVVLVDVRWLTAIVAVVLLAAVGAAAGGWRVKVTPGRELVAGVVSGVTGAATALGGPPLAILYRERDPLVLRPTLSLVWAVGIVLTLAGLGAAGEFTRTQALAGALLAVLLLGGMVIARLVVHRLPIAGLRAAILWWAGIGGVAALVRVVLS